MVCVWCVYDVCMMCAYMHALYAHVYVRVILTKFFTYNMFPVQTLLPLDKDPYQTLLKPI